MLSSRNSSIKLGVIYSFIGNQLIILPKKQLPGFPNTHLELRSSAYNEMYKSRHPIPPAFFILYTHTHENTEAVEAEGWCTYCPRGDTPAKKSKGKKDWQGKRLLIGKAKMRMRICVEKKNSHILHPIRSVLHIPALASVILLQILCCSCLCH